MDDHAFPSYTTAKAKSKTYSFLETGDAFVRELDMSRIMLRLTAKTDSSGDKNEGHISAQLQGQTLQTLVQCLYKPTELTLKGTDGLVNKVTVQLRYLPVQMHLDPSESINNQGMLRVDVLDAADLPSADRNGFSDPYCKFKLNGKEVFKTKVQKKTLHPSWNEYFEASIPSRTAADFKCDVYDWDFGDRADFLGGTPIDLTKLEPFKPQEMHFTLDGKSGVLRLKMLFKPDYVTRHRQGTSTFSGTFAPAGKVVGAPVKGVTKVGGAVGGGLIKGASFMKRSFKGSKDEQMEANGTVTDGDESPVTPQITPSRSAALVDGPAAPSTPSGTPQTRQKSYNSATSGTSKAENGTAKGAENGTANFTVISATGFPPSAEVRVEVKMVGPKGSKSIHKTKAIESSSGTVEFGDRETFKISCSADTQFQIFVQDHGTFKSKDLGDGTFFVSDQGIGSEQSVTAGPGTVVLRSSFSPSTGGHTESLKPTSSGRDSPDSKRESRRSFFGKREASGKHEG
jgi:C2 domain